MNDDEMKSAPEVDRKIGLKPQASIPLKPPAEAEGNSILRMQGLHIQDNGWVHGTDCKSAPSVHLFRGLICDHLRDLREKFEILNE